MVYASTAKACAGAHISTGAGRRQGIGLPAFGGAPAEVDHHRSVDFASVDNFDKADMMLLKDLNVSNMMCVMLYDS